MNRCNVYVAGICVEVIASYLISIPQSQIVSAGYRHQKILICNTIYKQITDNLGTFMGIPGAQNIQVILRLVQLVTGFHEPLIRCFCCILHLPSPQDTGVIG